MNVKRMTSMGWTAESEAIRRRSDRTLRNAMERRSLGVGVGKEELSQSDRTMPIGLVG